MFPWTLEREEINERKNGWYIHVQVLKEVVSAKFIETE
jgi:hypothetical protein